MEAAPVEFMVLYATVWDHIKAKWHLTATASEWGAPEQMTATC
jgi:hypothetical protein